MVGNNVRRKKEEKKNEWISTWIECKMMCSLLKMKHESLLCDAEVSNENYTNKLAASYMQTIRLADYYMYETMGKLNAKPIFDVKQLSFCVRVCKAEK